MPSLTGRLAALEQRRGGAAIGFAVTRQDPRGAVLQVVIYAGEHVYPSEAAFEAANPEGHIAGGIVFVDDGTEPEHSSLMAEWFSPKGES